MRRAKLVMTEIVELFNVGQRSDALDCLYNNLDEMLLAGEFEEVRVFLARLEREGDKLPESAHLSARAITKNWQTHLQWAGIVCCWARAGEVIRYSKEPDFMGLNYSQELASVYFLEDFYE